MWKLIVLGCATLAAQPGYAQAPAEPPATYGPPIVLSNALVVLERGRELAARCGLAMAFAVVEPSGELVAFVKMDDIPYASTRLAQQKARTSARFRMTTAQFEERVQAGRAVLMSSDEVIAIGGGVPIVEDGRVVGALGVSGGTAVQDGAVAAAAIETRPTGGRCKG
jgi:glc operon protein GlcG